MRHHGTSNSTMAPSGAAALRNFSSPIPYLFGGLALMLAVISVALLILACSFHTQHSSSSTSDAGDEEKEKPTHMDSSEPKIVVIMAGESNPTYLARPMISSISHAAAQAVPK